MLSRRKDFKSRDGTIKHSSSAGVSKSSDTATIEASISKAPIQAKGEKRKAPEVDPHDEKGSEYLRRKHNFIKSSIRVDYQPDICKDYKETGFCGFGDSCKFLHDRSDYKCGWQLEQEYAKGQYKDEDDDKYLIKDSDDEQEHEEDSVDKCAICKEKYKDPIVTKCKHYFCGACADEKCTEKCYLCDKSTSGIFKVAKLDSIVNSKS